MSAYKIENGIPAPPRRIRSGVHTESKAKAVWKLDPGQSVFFPDMKHSVQSYLPRKSIRGKMTYVTKKVDGGFRVWRLT